MPKTFYTERDIVELAAQGVTALEVDDDVVLTELARDEALKRGLRLVRRSEAHGEDDAQAELIHRVKAAVIARLGEQVDENTLNAVISKVVKGSGN
jgi:hypothetical protein